MKNIDSRLDLINSLGDLYVTIKEDDETVRREKANSYVSNFLIGLHWLTVTQEATLPVLASNPNIQNIYANYDTVTKNSNEVVRLERSFLDDLDNAGHDTKIAVEDSTGLDSSIEGFYDWEFHDNQDYILLKDNNDGSYIQHPGGTPDGGTIDITIFEKDQGSGSNIFRGPYIRVGNSIKSNSIDIFRLDDRVFDGNPLSYGTPAVEAPVASTSRTTMVIKQPITNPSGNGDFTFDELGLYCQSGFEGGVKSYDPTEMLIARDLINHTISDGATQTIEYSIRTPLQSSSPYQSGIVRQFLELLYRQMSNSSRTIKNIYNSDKNIGSRGDQFRSNETGGVNRGEWTGPQIGLSDYEVSTSDPSLVFDTDPGFELPDDNNPSGFFGSRIPHGVDNLHAQHLGSFVENIEIDTSNNIATFEISKIFHNLSGGSIDIKEIGLNMNASYEGYHCIYREVLGSTVSFLDGEFMKVKFTLEISV